ncbi:hypothetical protein DRO54_10180 [Candidatus Bathyarchaeota archaeon]|nr:MAG: hypothetical protein DRO54_10180 [Candidatus Bathyarchaeota archaeon]
MGKRRSKITFSLLEPIKYLIENGEVYTIRPQKSKVVDENGVYIYYKDMRIGIGKKERVGSVARLGGWKVVKKDKTVVDLSEFVDKSGFKTVKDWIKAVVTINKRMPAFLQLYRVVVEEWYYEKDELLETLAKLDMGVRY